MSLETFLGQSFGYLAAAVIAVPLAKRFGLGSVLGYLIAGMLIGPWGIGWVGSEGEDVMHFAEFGVVMMLFVIGLELEPKLLWRLRAPILGLGGAQVGLTTGIVTAIAMAFGFLWNVALAIGLGIALSSTAIVLQTLNEKDLMPTRAGQSAFSVLLFQDIAVIPMLAAMPLLAIYGQEIQPGWALKRTGVVRRSVRSSWGFGVVSVGIRRVGRASARADAQERRDDAWMGGGCAGGG